MNEQTCCCVKPRYTLVFACSGAADVGAISDRAARKLSAEKSAAMCCAAAIASGNEEIMEKARNAKKNIVIDGCDKQCAKLIMEQNGFDVFDYIQIEELGMKKGESPVTEERIEQICAAARQCLEGNCR